MTPAEHYARAEQLAVNAGQYLAQTRPDADAVARAAALATLAHAHATLAGCAAPGTAEGEMLRHWDAEMQAATDQPFRVATEPTPIPVPKPRPPSVPMRVRQDQERAMTALGALVMAVRESAGVEVTTTIEFTDGKYVARAEWLEDMGDQHDRKVAVSAPCEKATLAAGQLDAVLVERGMLPPGPVEDPDADGDEQETP